MEEKDPLPPSQGGGQVIENKLTREEEIKLQQNGSASKISDSVPSVNDLHGSQGDTLNPEKHVNLVLMESSDVNRMSIEDLNGESSSVKRDLKRRKKSKGKRAFMPQKPTFLSMLLRQTPIPEDNFSTSPIKTTSTWEKVGWTMLLLISVATAVFFVYQSVKDFFRYTVSTNMDSLSIPYKDVYFPAVTICNMNFMQRSVLEKFNIQNTTVMDIFDRMEILGTHTNFTEEEEDIYQHFPEKVRSFGPPTCDNMLLSLAWRNKEYPTEDLGEEIFFYRQTTDLGLCCQLFPGMLQSENNNAFNLGSISFWMSPSPWKHIFDGYKKGIHPGKQGVKVLIDVETYEYFSVHSSGSEGVLMHVHHYRDVPLMRKEAFILPPGHEVDVGISVTEITTSPDAIKRFEPMERDCYIDDEVNLTSLPLEKGYRMSLKNCLYDKAIHAIVRECRCIPSFYVKRTFGDVETCRGPALGCAFDMFDSVNQTTDGGTVDKCRVPCNDQIYESRIAFAAYPNKALLPHRKETCHLVNKLVKICSGWLPSRVAEGTLRDALKIKKKWLLLDFPNICTHLSKLSVNTTCADIRTEVSENTELKQTLYEYAKKNLMWINVYAKDSVATRILRDEKMTRIGFIANVGGLLGLCMGFNLISAAKIIYFLFKIRKKTFPHRHSRRKGDIRASK